MGHNQRGSLRLSPSRPTGPTGPTVQGLGVMRLFSQDWWAGLYARHPRAQFVAAIILVSYAVYAMVHALLDWDGFHKAWDDSARWGESGPWVLLACSPIMFWAGLMVGRIAWRRIRGDPVVVDG